MPAIDEATALIADPKITPPHEIVTGLLHAGTKAVLASGSKVGKTWVLLYLALCVASGTRFLKWNTTCGKVLFVNLEVPRAFMKERVKLVQSRKQLPNADNLDIWSLRGHAAGPESLIEAIIAACRTKQYVLIILDPIYKLLTGVSENVAGSVGSLCHLIERLVEKSGAAVLYAHHFTKGNAAKKHALDRMSGSGVFSRDADTIITLTEHEEPGCFVLETTLRNLPPQEPFVVEWSFPLMVERPDLDPAELKGGQTVQGRNDLESLLSLLDENPLTTGEWQRAAEEQGYSRATFYRAEKKLKEAGRLAFDRKAKTWARAGEAELVEGAADCAEKSGTNEIRETSETTETLADDTQPISEHGTT